MKESKDGHLHGTQKISKYVKSTFLNILLHYHFGQKFHEGSD